MPTDLRSVRVPVIVAVLAAGAGLLAQTDVSPAPASVSFPSSWIGHWSGPAELIAPGRPSHDFTMELIVAPTDDPVRFSWTIIYSEPTGQRQERAYELIVRDAAKGVYAIDEKTGIVIPTTLIDSALYSSFEVQGVRINTRESLVHAGTPQEAIEVEMVSGSTESVETSGGKDGVPEVKSVVPRSLQRATMKRVPEPPGKP